MPAEAPTLSVFLYEIIWCFIAGDFFIYWEHRIMRMIPYLRHNVHSVHHKYSAVFSWAGGWVHPFEDTIVIMCEIIPAQFLFNVHPLSLWIFTALWVICLVDEHSGHAVWWSP